MIYFNKNRRRVEGKPADVKLHRGLVRQGQIYQAMHKLDMTMQDNNETNNGCDRKNCRRLIHCFLISYRLDEKVLF